MEKNLDFKCRLIRVIAGLAVIGWGIYAKSLWGALGLLFLAGAWLGYCPFAKGSCGSGKEKKEGSCGEGKKGGCGCSH